MDAEKPKTRIIPAPEEIDQARAEYAANFDMVRARDSADRARTIAEGESLNRIQPDNSERAKARWQNEGGGGSADDPLSPWASN